MTWPSKDPRDYVESGPVDVEPEPEPESVRPSGSPSTEAFAVRASRFNANAIREGIERAAALYGLQCWVSVGDGRLRRDLSVRVHGDPTAIVDLVAYIESLRAQTGDAGGPF